jgi:hypothetical protein
LRCRLCNDHGEDSIIEVHHRTYKNLDKSSPVLAAATAAYRKLLFPIEPEQLLVV